MQQSVPIEASEYSGWDDDDLGPESPGAEAAEAAATAAFELVVDAAATGDRLDKWLARRLADYSRSRLQRWIAEGHVRVNGEVAHTRRALWAGDIVAVAPQPSDQETAFAPQDVALDVVHEDDALIVIDKRAGMVVHPASGNWNGTLLNGLLHRWPELAGVARAGIVHRLDKDTSGLMVVARTVLAQTDLVRQLQARTVGRTYAALVHGTPAKSGRVDLAIGRDPRERTRMAAFPPNDAQRAASTTMAKPATTQFETLASVEVTAAGALSASTASLVICKLETGRTHQIRVQMQAIGHPLIGDQTYGSKRAAPAFARQALHAWRLRLVHPSTRAAMQWTAGVPDDLAGIAGRLGIDIADHLTQYAARERVG